MFKILAASTLAMGLATSAFAQVIVTDRDSRYNSGVYMERTVPAEPYVDTMTTQSIVETPNYGLSGSSSAGTNEYCPPGTPGAGAQGVPTGSANPYCNN